MANHIFILNYDIHYEIYWGRLNAIIVHSALAPQKLDELVLHSDPGDQRSKGAITPIYKTVTYVGPANVDDVNFKYSIVSFR